MSPQNELPQQGRKPSVQAKNKPKNRGTFNPKVAGSSPARPIRNCLKIRDKFDNRVSDGRGMGLAVPSHREDTFHLGRLEFSLGTLPVSVDVGCHFERRVPEMA